MTFIVSGSNEKEFKLAPAGNHLARCYRLIDLGTQKSVYMGVEKKLRKVMISWELHGEDNDGNPLLTDDGQPLMMSRQYTTSLSEKATLRIMLESWRGKEFTLDELSGFDLSSLLGKYCMLQVTHDKASDGKTYANVSSVASVPPVIRKAGLPDGVNKTLMFQLSNFDQAVFDGFSDGIKKKIMESPEYKALKNIADDGFPTTVNTSDDMDDDIPF